MNNEMMKLEQDANQRPPTQLNEIVIPDTSDSEHDDVLMPSEPVLPPPTQPPARPTTLTPTAPLVFVQQPSPTSERPSRDRTVVRTKSKAAQVIGAAINQATGTKKTVRRSTTGGDDDEVTTPTGSAKFVDRCVTKMKTLINK